MEAQLRIRQNAMEMQDYMKDLMDWQQTMKAKASSASSSPAAHEGMPTVRGRAAGSVQPAAPQMQLPVAHASTASQAGTATSQPAGHTYKNYSKWDKFDVDAALQEGEEAHKQQSSTQRTAQQPVPAAVPPVRGRQPASAASAQTASPATSATSLKDRGNKLFQAGYYDEAIDCYNQSIAIQPTSLAFANRAMALLKQQKYQQAEQDCTAALMLDASYVKALHRRGTARRQLARHLEAAADFEEALRLEPGNKALQGDRDTALQAHLQQEKLPLSSNWISIPLQVEPQQQQQQEAVGEQAAVAAAAAASTQQGAAVNALPSKQHALLTAVGSRTSPAPAADSPGPLKSPSSNISRPLQRTPTPVSPSSSRVAPHGCTEAAAAAAAQLAAARLTSSLKPPKTSSEFEAAWRSCKGDAKLQAKYLQLLEPAQLPAIFKNSLTAHLLTSILSVALPAAAAAPADDAGSGGRALGAAHAVMLVQQLVNVPRFGMTVMCLTSKDKAALRQLWDAAAVGADAQLQQQLQVVRNNYRL